MIIITMIMMMVMMTTTMMMMIMMMIIANWTPRGSLAIYHLISNARSWNNY